VARRTRPLSRPTRRDRRAWAAAAVISLPLLTWLGMRAAALPPVLSAFCAGTLAGLAASLPLRAACKRLVRWANTTIEGARQ
jgi:hypothetical protein